RILPQRADERAAHLHAEGVGAGVIVGERARPVGSETLADDGDSGPDAHTEIIVAHRLGRARRQRRLRIFLRRQAHSVVAARGQKLLALLALLALGRVFHGRRLVLLRRHLLLRRLGLGRRLGRLGVLALL